MVAASACGWHGPLVRRLTRRARRFSIETIYRSAQTGLKDVTEAFESLPKVTGRTQLGPVSYTHLDVYKRQELHKHFEITHVTLQLETPGYALQCTLRTGGRCG